MGLGNLSSTQICTPRRALKSKGTLAHVPSMVKERHATIDSDPNAEVYNIQTL